MRTTLIGLIFLVEFGFFRFFLDFLNYRLMLQQP